MLDHKLFINAATDTLNLLRARQVSEESLQQITDLVELRRATIQNTESLRQVANEANAKLQAYMKTGQPTAVDDARAKLKSLKKEIKEAESKQKEVLQKFDALLMMLPNTSHESSPVGSDESCNRVERVIGDKPNFHFQAKPHWEIGESLGILDFSAASKLSGARFALYRGDGARLERALISFMLDLAQEHGYLEILPPVLVKRDAMLAAGQYPKFEGESFETLDGEYVLIPTSEVPLVNLHRDEILGEGRLPLRYTAFSPCFRREAGAAGKDTRGLIRNHQFNKVELVSLCHPNESFDELERLTSNAEEVLKRLELSYRVVSLATGDLGFCASKTYDLEVWLPGQEAYREISSCSNCTDFQARRGKIRYRPNNVNNKKGKPALVHTLNGSGLAVGRTVVAILENYQQADGSVRVPDVLKPYLGKDLISPSL
jgi:seryl-tRNA synthetase